MARTVYHKCPWCGKRGVHWYNRDAVLRAQRNGLGAYKMFKCKYCGRIDRARTKWVRQYRPFG